MSLPWDDTRTDAEGRFHLSRPAPLVRFSKNGYGPLTIALAVIKPDVVLRPSSQASWQPPVCPDSPSTRFGDVMRFSAPPGVHPTLQRDVDYFTISIHRAGATLFFGSGGLWTMGLPNETRLAAMVAVQERDVLTPWGRSCR